MHSLRFRDVTISWLDHTPHASAVYASCSALLPPHATLASQAACYGLTWAGLAPADRASFGWRLHIYHPAQLSATGCIRTPHSVASVAARNRAMRAIVIIAGLLISAGTANAIKCQSSPLPSNKGQWAWRLIDNKKCWYALSREFCRPAATT